MSHFGFIGSPTLRGNLDVAFDHVITLIPLSESESYRNLEKSSFRKTIIIFTASIIEALLCNLVSEKCTEDDLTMYKWELENPSELYEVNENYKIVGGKYRRKSIKLKLEKMNLSQINETLHNKEILNDDLFGRVDKVRELRNDQHFGTHRVIKGYNKDDIEFVFSVARDVMKLARAKI